MNFFKRIFKVCILKYKYRKYHVKFSFNSIIGYKSTFEGYNRICEGAIFNGHLGYGSYIGKYSKIAGYVGRYTCIAESVNVITGLHPSHTFVSQHPAFYSLLKQCGMTYVTTQNFAEFRFADEENKYPVYIGNDVWIGHGVTIMSGVKIGDGAILAANSTVVSDVKPYEIVGGNPAKLIKTRFNKEEIDYLCKMKWWNKSEKWIKENIEKFSDIKLIME